MLALFSIYFDQVHQDLTEKLEQYFDIVEKASNDKINLAYKRMAVIKS